GAYRSLNDDLAELAESINWRHGDRFWRPIEFVNVHWGQERIYPLYRAAAACVVTSLHDGMNLVAKEFVASRADERGALVLSRFTGSAQELGDALLVNPYSVDELAEAYHRALTMAPEEQEQRMRRMRRQVQDHNIYRWAGVLLSEACKLAGLAPTPALAAEANGLAA